MSLYVYGPDSTEYSLLDGDSDWHVEGTTATNRDRSAEGLSPMIQFAHTWDYVWAKWMMSDEHDADDDFTQLNFDCIVEGSYPVYDDEFFILV